MLKCNKCNKNFSIKSGLDYHIKNNACKNTKFECELCDKKFTTMASMKRHKKSNCKKKDQYISIAENQQINDQILQLQEDNAKLKKEIMTFRKENMDFRKENMDFRKENIAFRKEMASFRKDVQMLKEMTTLKKDMQMLKNIVTSNAIDTDTINADTIKTVHKATKVKRKKIPETIKDIIWKSTYGNVLEHGCICCSKTVITRSSCEYAHKIAHSNGGTVEPDNIIPLCHTCNHKMGDIDYNEYKDILCKSNNATRITKKHTKAKKIVKRSKSAKVSKYVKVSKN